LAALPLITRDKRLGIVFVQDERPDGSIVVLACTEGEEEGVAAPSHLPEEEEEWFPLAQRLAIDLERRGGPSDHFGLVVDTTQLPQGRLVFDIDRFVEELRLAVDRGERHVLLDLNRARSWGLKLEDFLQW
jgi:hypothetical protein